jgi:hypothetical protein
VNPRIFPYACANDIGDHGTAPPSKYESFTFFSSCACDSSNTSGSNVVHAGTRKEAAREVASAFANARSRGDPRSADIARHRAAVASRASASHRVAL